jgi:hypothetical protein
MKLKNSKFYNKPNPNVEDRTTDIPPDPQEGEKLWGGGVYHKPKNTKISDDVEFNPDDKKEMSVVKELAKKNIEGTTPTPTPRPSDGFKSHDNLVTPGKWRTKSK